MSNMMRRIGLLLGALASPVTAQTSRPCPTMFQWTDVRPGHDGRVQTGEMQWYPAGGFLYANVRAILDGTTGLLKPTPGEAFGVVGYSCASCEVKRERGPALTWTFFSEPVVTAVDVTTPLKPGDVIEAVNGMPITTIAGLSQFVSPAAGANTLAVRRGREDVALKFQISPNACSSLMWWLAPGNHPPMRFDSLLSARFGGSTTRGLGPAGDSLVAAMHALEDRMAPAAASRTTRYGFAVWCVSTCMRARSTDGIAFFRYTDPPLISSLREGSPAAAAGLKVGDLILKVDGNSIVDDLAALELFRTDRKDPLSVIVLRDGTELGFTVHPPK